MSRIAIFSDLHRCLDELQELLDHPEVKSCNKIYSLGDIFDKGTGDINKILDLLQERHVEVVMGNHDQKQIEFVKKKRKPETIENVERRSQYEVLTGKNKEFLLTWKPFIQLDGIFLVHGGVGPHTIIQPLSGKDFNEITRMRYVNKNTLQKVSTVHDPINHTWGPEIPVEQTWDWQEVYDSRFGVVLHGHNIFSQKTPRLWYSGLGGYVETIDTGRNDLKFFKVISLDTGCVMGGYLTAAVIDTETKLFKFIQIKAKAEYCSAHLGKDA